MRLFSKIRQFSREIKLIIITALVVSCVGVYAAGECIISATADDITYNNTTVQAAIDELYSMSESYCPPGYECRALKYVTDCDNNRIYSTTPSNLFGLAKIMAENAYLDNGKSEFVTSCNGVSFNAMSSDTNGKGIYEIASTKNDTYPIYYYRGAVNNNNVKFAGFCWKAIRTTDTGGVKLIYNGEPDQDGYCTNTIGTSTQIGTSKFNSSSSYSPATLGYMYGTSYNRTSRSAPSTSYVYGKNVSYNGGTYTLTNTFTSTGTWSTDKNTVSNYHYTCFSTGTSCSTVYYVYYTNETTLFNMSLTNGKKIEDYIDDMLNISNLNTTNSMVKTEIDNWYNTNLSTYSSKIEDIIYCGDRNISSLGGWNPNGGSLSEYLSFDSYAKTYTNYTPSLSCTRALDKFTVSSTKGNGVLNYPVGLITSDEVMYAGGKTSSNNSTYYLYTNQNYWTMSPSHFDSSYADLVCIAYTGTIISHRINETDGIRPVISLVANASVKFGGDGTSTSPYEIDTN